MSYNLLKGKKGIITGVLNKQSIAWYVAKRAVEEGAEILLTNTPMAIRFGTINQLAATINSPVVAADATSVSDLEQLVDTAMEHFGGQVDFVLHSIGMSPNIRKGIGYQELNYDFYAKTLDISAMSYHKLLQTLYKKDALRKGGSVVALSYIAGDRAMRGYGDMADAKAMLQSITRNFGIIFAQERGVRVNTVSQSPTMTTAGQGIEGMTEMIDTIDHISPLGNASAADCADYVITLFSNLTRKITMQTLYSDGGYSSVLPVFSER